MEDLEDRIMELEIRFSHQARLLEELNGVVAECNRRISHLEKNNLLLANMLKNLAPELPESFDE